MSPVHTVGIIGAGVNPGSAKQVGAWLKENMNAASLASWPRTAKGALATNASAWKARPDVPVSAAMLSYKRARTRLNSFGEKYRQHIHPVTGRMHASFRLGGIVSGRIACSKPNLQQVPREPEFRALFMPGDGRVLVVADYSQIELRVAVLLSKDASMLQAYRDGMDIHRATAAAMLDIRPEEVTSTQRTQAKALTLGTLYGSGPMGLAKSARDSYGVGMTVKQAEAFQAKFYGTYPALRCWQQRIAKTSGRSGIVATPGGRRRDFRSEKAGWKYTEAVNTPGQAGAAEVMLEALAVLQEGLSDSQARLVNMVHDELVVETRTDEAESVRRIVEDSMRIGFTRLFDAPYMLHDLVESGIGASWADAK